MCGILLNFDQLHELFAPDLDPAARINDDEDIIMADPLVTDEQPKLCYYIYPQALLKTQGHIQANCLSLLYSESKMDSEVLGARWYLPYILDLHLPWSISSNGDSCSLTCTLSVSVATATAISWLEAGSQAAATAWL